MSSNRLKFISNGAVILIVILVALVAGFVSSRSLCSKTDKLSDDEKMKLINEAVKAVLQCYSTLPGWSLGIVRDGQVFLTRGYGFADPENEKKADANTVFGIASITKSFTALLALQILADNSLSRDTKISEILGSKFRYQSDFLTQYATVGDLLSHRTGMPKNNFVRYQYNYTREKLARDMAKMAPVAQYRDSYVYSNLGYGLLAHISERLGGKAWEVLVRERLFKPLKMGSTFLRGHDAGRRNVSNAYYFTKHRGLSKVSEKLLRHWGRIGASGSVMTTAPDMTRWMHLLLNNGLSRERRRVIDEDVVAAAKIPRQVMDEIPGSLPWSIMKPTFPQTFIWKEYASGLRNGFYRGFPIISHTGGTFGYVAIMTLIPSKNLGVFLVSNGIDSGMKARLSLSLYILDLMLNETPWLNHSTICSFPNPWLPPKSTTTEKDDIPFEGKAGRLLSEYVGMYGKDEYGKLSVNLNSTSGALELNYGILEADLSPEEDLDYFTLKGKGATWFLYGRNTHFNYNNVTNIIDSVTLSRLDRKSPPTFFRT